MKLAPFKSKHPFQENLRWMFRTKMIFETLRGRWKMKETLILMATIAIVKMSSRSMKMSKNKQTTGSLLLAIANQSKTIVREETAHHNLLLHSKMLMMRSHKWRAKMRPITLHHLKTCKKSDQEFCIVQ